MILSLCCLLYTSVPAAAVIRKMRALSGFIGFKGSVGGLLVIGVEKYGLVNFAIIFSFYFQIFNEFGFDLSNVRHVVNNRDNQEK